MNAEETAANSPAGSASKMELSGRARRQIFTYLGVLIILMDFGAPLGGLLYVPLSFVLKNKLHLEAHEASEFKLKGLCTSVRPV
jgi:hypothetical protein